MLATRALSGFGVYSRFGCDAFESTCAFAVIIRGSDVTITVVK